MASAFFESKIITPEKVVTIPAVVEKKVTLSLNEDEALALLVLTGCVGGNPDTTSRGLIENDGDKNTIHYALCRALGVSEEDVSFLHAKYVDRADASVYFKGKVQR